MSELKDASRLLSVSIGLHLFIGSLRNLHVIESLSAEEEFKIWWYWDGFDSFAQDLFIRDFIAYYSNQLWIAH